MLPGRMNRSPGKVRALYATTRVAPSSERGDDPVAHQPPRLWGRRARRLAPALLVAVLLLAGCSAVVGGLGRSGVPGLAAPANLPVVGDGHTPFDTLAKNAITDVIAFWKAQYPQVASGATLPALAGQVYSVDDKAPTAQDSDNACLARNGVKVITDNAFYCSLDDSVAYDRVGFIPRLAEKYGDYFVAAVFAHEFGHAVQARLHLLSQPSIAKETQADCAAGAFTTAVMRFQAPHVQVAAPQLDQVLVGYLQLRDPTFHDATERGTHGNGFDRLSAFSEGVNKGVTACYAADWNTRAFTERPFSTEADYSSGGNEPLDKVLDPSTAGGGLEPSLNAYWASAAKSIGKTWQDVKIAQAAQPACGASPGSQFGYCPNDNTVYYSTALAQKAYSFGDYSLGEMISYGWGLAVRKQLFNRSLTDADALLAAGCYSGAYAKSINRSDLSGFALSPPDMDEASVAVLTLIGNPQAYGDRGTSGLQRISSFNKGYFGSLPSC
jgi:predicted metalloprotease